MTIAGFNQLLQGPSFRHAGNSQPSLILIANSSPTINRLIIADRKAHGLTSDAPVTGCEETILLQVALIAPYSIEMR